MDLMQSMNTSASGMRAQSTRMNIISENIANAQSVISEDGGPYRRQLVFFQAVQNAQGAPEVKVSRVQKDYQTPLKMQYDPTHPLADDRGFVAMPNVSTNLENADMREASRAYEANMSAITTAKDMMQRSIDILR